MHTGSSQLDYTFMKLMQRKFTGKMKKVPVKSRQLQAEIKTKLDE